MNINIGFGDLLMTISNDLQMGLVIWLLAILDFFLGGLFLWVI